MAFKLKPGKLDGQVYGEYAWLSFAKRMHARPCKHRPTIGFEFEIPLDREGMEPYTYGKPLDEPCDWRNNPRDRVNDDSPFSAVYLKDRGIKSHYEEGGLEINSPVFYNIQQARATAKALIEDARNTPWLDPDYEHTREVDDIHCGIHVHAGTPDAQEYSGLARLLLNTTEAYEFVGKLSGRVQGIPYAQQGWGAKWDEDPKDLGQYYGKCLPAMARCNMDGTTLEYRIMQGEAKNLVKGIDFAHSFTRWMQSLNYDFRHFKGTDPRGPSYTLSCTQWVFEGGTKREQFLALKDTLPSLSDYKAWLMRQPGYAVLKADPSMDLI